MRTFSIQNLHVEQHDSRIAMGEAAGRKGAEILARLLQEKEEVRIMFGAAPSQNEMLDELVRHPLDWERVVAFHMDEYTGLSDGDSACFSSYLKQHIANRVPFKELHFLQSDALDVQAECIRYAFLLRSCPIDLCFLGVGENGHLAFNDPHIAFFNDSETVKLVQLDQKCRLQQVHDGCFPDLDAVPTHAMTVTIPALMRSRHMVCTVPGPAKAQAIKSMLEGEIAEVCPASILRTHRSAYLFIDTDAASLLKVW